jgi:hypothetical protein
MGMSTIELSGELEARIRDASQLDLTPPSQKLGALPVAPVPAPGKTSLV